MKNFPRSLVIFSLAMNVVFFGVFGLVNEWERIPVESTITADGFNENGFRRLHCGQSYQDVLSGAGYPIELLIRSENHESRYFACRSDLACYDGLFKQVKSSMDRVTFVYQKGRDTNSDYHYKHVVFDALGNLYNIESGMYID